MIDPSVTTILSACLFMILISRDRGLGWSLAMTFGCAVLLQFAPVFFAAVLGIVFMIGLAVASFREYEDNSMPLDLPVMFRKHQSSSPSDPRHQVPEVDVNGSVIGYRYFNVASEDGTLFSIGVGMTGDKVNPITGVHRGWYKDNWNVSDRVPTLKNDSGIYAAKTPDSPLLDGYGGVLAKVELSGRVIEGEYGYRAQFCRVIEILED
jgi:hypothetical protein